MQRLLDKEDLTRIIESLRKEMIRTGIEEGLDSKKTIEISKNLDEYIVEYLIKESQNKI